MHKSGYVNIIGNPNVGKSTLMNAIVGEHMSIISAKPQTTRHRILGIVSSDEFQIVFSDTPGMIHDPHYKMQEAMNKFAFSIFKDADVVLFMTDLTEDFDGTERIFKILKEIETPKLLVVNKIDLGLDHTMVNNNIDWFHKQVRFDQTHLISALKKDGIEPLKEAIVDLLPEGPEYYPKDQLSDKPQRFFVAEIIREQIFELYHQEIPYSSEVRIDRYEEMEKNGGPFAKIYADIYVMRRTQKQILIGKNGDYIKKLGINSRKKIEKYLGHHIYLELYVRVKEKWRDDENLLKNFGYLT